MKIISLQELRKKLEWIGDELSEVNDLLSNPEILIADIPAPEKKVRKKRVKKQDAPEAPTPEAIKVKRGRRKKVNQSTSQLPPMYPDESNR